MNCIIHAPLGGKIDRPCFPALDSKRHGQSVSRTRPARPRCPARSKPSPRRRADSRRHSFASRQRLECGPLHGRSAIYVGAPSPEASSGARVRWRVRRSGEAWRSVESFDSLSATRGSAQCFRKRGLCGPPRPTTVLQREEYLAEIAPATRPGRASGPSATTRAPLLFFVLWAFSRSRPGIQEHRQALQARRMRPALPATASSCTAI